MAIHRMKELRDMSLTELWELFPIILKDHNSEYGMWYEEECASLLENLRDFDVFRVNHIGSTAVKGLLAKPTIDILLEFNEGYDKKAITQKLLENGWLVMADNDQEQTIDLNKGYTINGFAERVFHLHIKPVDDHGELYFRDYLREHSDVAKEYGELKLILKNKFEHDRDAYTLAKKDFVEKYTSKARIEFKGRYEPKGV